MEWVVSVQRGDCRNVATKLFHNTVFKFNRVGILEGLNGFLLEVRERDNLLDLTKDHTSGSKVVFGIFELCFVGPKGFSTLRNLLQDLC
jgi:hypothetical protein